MSDIIFGGGRDTTDVIGAPRRERPENFREGILFSEEAGEVPFTALLAKASSSSINDPQHNWFEEDRSPQRGILSGAIDAVVTTIPSITAGGGITDEVRLNTLVYVEETGEIMRVTSNQTTGAASFTVERGYANTTAAAVTPAAGVNINLAIIGSVQEEGSAKPQTVQYLGRWDHNYTQILRTNAEVTRTMAKTSLRTEPAKQRLKAQTSMYHAQEIERALWFGSRWGKEENSGTEPLINGRPARTMGGFLDFLGRYDTANPGEERIFSFTDPFAVTAEDMDEFFYRTFLYGRDQKVAFAGNRAITTINQIARLNSDYNLSVGERRYGLRVHELVTPYGDIRFMRHPMFNQFRGLKDIATPANSYTAFESMLAVIDMRNVEYLYIDDTHFITDQEEDGEDGHTEGWLTEATIRWPNAREHSVCFLGGAATP